MFISANIKTTKHLLILLSSPLIPLILAAFTHLWNPVGFPDLFYDEATYIHRALRVLSGEGPQEEQGTYYDHPYFGQLFLAGVFKIIGYPELLHSSSNGDVHSIEMLYMVPRILMGLLAVLDTFLVYKISEYRYDKRVAFIASILFAVMPLTWVTRRILLDSIQLPFLLSSILFAVYYNKKNLELGGQKVDNKINDTDNEKYKLLVPVKQFGNVLLTGLKYVAGKHIVLLSGIFLGLAIFTKIPVFTMIPLVGFLIVSSSTTTNANKNNSKRDNGSIIGRIRKIKTTRDLKTLGLWFVPVILISAIWPAYAALHGQFNDWLHGIFYQTHRQGQTGTIFSASNPLIKNITDTLFKMDPVLLILGLAGLIFTIVIKKDLLLFLWVAPFLFFLYVIDYVSYWFFIPLIPVLCIGSAGLIMDLSNKITSGKNVIHRILPFALISIIGIFGLVSTSLIITTDMSSHIVETTAFIANYLGSPINKNEDITLILSPVYYWVFEDIYGKSNAIEVRDHFDGPDTIKTHKIILMLNRFKVISEDPFLRMVYSNAPPLKVAHGPAQSFDRNKYPYTNLDVNYEGKTEQRTIMVEFDKNHHIPFMSKHGKSIYNN